VACNFHGGNAIYTPIALVNGNYIARPLYYSMLAFRASAQGHIIPAILDSRGLNVKAYATVAADNTLWLTLINKTGTHPVILQVNTGRPISMLEVQRLQGESLTATDGITFAGSMVGQNGTFIPSSIEKDSASGNSFMMSLPVASAAVVHVQ
jgi:hypothetical protein